jgi:hypothetical protein
VPASFVAEHTVQSVLDRNDHALEDLGRLTGPKGYNADKDIYEAVVGRKRFRA